MRNSKLKQIPILINSIDRSKLSNYMLENAFTLIFPINYPKKINKVQYLSNLKKDICLEEDAAILKTSKSQKFKMCKHKIT